MTYEARLQISKLLFTVMLTLFIALYIYAIYYMTILDEGHLFETTRNSIRAEYELREIVLKLFILTPLLTLLWSKQFGYGGNIRLTGYILSLIILSPWASSLLAKATHLPSEGIVGTLPWQACVSLTVILLGCILSIKPKITRTDAGA